MRLLLSILTAMLMVQSVNAQALWRNYWTTNRNPQNALSLTNLQATNITGTIPPSNLSTNTSSAGQVLTATSVGSAAWQDSQSIAATNGWQGVHYGTNQGALTISMSAEWSAFSTNADFTISTLSDVSTYGTNIQKHTIIITNTAGPTTKLMTVPASWIKHDGVNCYITNQGILTLVVYPGMGTNAAFKCLK